MELQTTSAAAKRKAESSTHDRLEELSDEVRRPFPGSRRIYVEGSRPDIRVPMRLIEQADTGEGSGAEENPPIPVYDTSGPYTDPVAAINLRTGLPSVRSEWIEERGDTELLGGLTSAFGREQANDERLDHLRFVHVRPPRRAMPGKCVIDCEKL